MVEFVEVAEGFLEPYHIWTNTDRFIFKYPSFISMNHMPTDYFWPAPGGWPWGRRRDTWSRPEIMNELQLKKARSNHLVQEEVDYWNKYE